MPALMTHHLFGEESIATLPAGLVATEDERIAFLIGNQGPDPFFFRFRTPHVTACMELGQVMHRSRMTRQFDALHEGTGHLPERDAGVGRAFTLGLLSHYVLDRTAHPFVYAQQYGIQEADESLARSGSQVHGVIESDLDVLMVQLKRQGATTEEYPPVDELVTTLRVSKVAGALMSFTARSVYGLPVGPTEYGGAVADMRLAYQLIEPAGSPISRVLSGLEGMVKDYSLLGSLAHRVTTVPPRGAGNLDHRTWRNPYTGEASQESFPEVFDRALEAYREVAPRFVAGDDMAAVTSHMNYSGRVLDASEECAED